MKSERVLISSYIAHNNPETQQKIRDSFLRSAKYSHGTSMVLAGEAANLDGLLEETQDLEPNIIYLNKGFQPLALTALTKTLAGFEFHPRVVLIGRSFSKGELLGFRQALVDGFLLEQDVPQRLTEAGRAVYKGEAYATPEIKRQLRNQEPHLRIPGLFAQMRPVLAPQEERVVALAVEGKTDQEIGDELTISEHTAHHHLNHIYEKLGIHNRLTLTRVALQMGIVRTPLMTPTDLGQQLSPSELAVFKRYVTGETREAGARNLGITYSTYSSHLHSIFNKFRGYFTSEIVLGAVQDGIIDIEDVGSS